MDWTTVVIAGSVSSHGDGRLLIRRESKVAIEGVSEKGGANNGEIGIELLSVDSFLIFLWSCYLLGNPHSLLPSPAHSLFHVLYVLYNAYTRK